MTVRKYPLQIVDFAFLAMPANARLLKVDVQWNEPMLWALVDEAAPVRTRGLRIAGTGHPLSDQATKWPYVGSVMLQSGDPVFHIFDMGEE